MKDEIECKVPDCKFNPDGYCTDRFLVIGADAMCENFWEKESDNG